MKNLLIAGIVALFVLSLASFALAEQGKDKAPPKYFEKEQPVGTKATCPVTGNEFTIAKDTAHVEYKGKHIYFCCPACIDMFKADPEKYLNL